ncbi:MAG: hypothetical protein NC093_05405 [Alistipes sp.]|nr:hypothetical protein [Alistipes sp.]
MKAFFSNIWTKRFVSLIAAFYTVGVFFLCYFSIFYDIHIHSRASVCLIVSGISAIALILMLYTRKQIITRICSFLILLAMLPVVLLYFDEKALLIPIIITGIVILLLSGAGEGVKTVIGTIILLLYIFGALGYFLFTTFFVTTAKTEIIAKGFSPSGRYRYSVINTEDKSGGSTAVYIEPNYADKKFPMVTFSLKNMDHICYLERPISENVVLDWTTMERQDITDELNGLSGNIMVTLTDSELERFGYPVDSRLEIAEADVYMLLEIGLTASDVEPLRLDDLNDTQLAVFDIGREASGKYYVLDPSQELLDEADSKGGRVYLSDLDAKGFAAFNSSHVNSWGVSLFNLQKDNEILLSSLSDDQLAEIGVSESGDVLTYNGKVCFRYYVAELEDYFEVDKRSFSVDLLS